MGDLGALVACQWCGNLNRTSRTSSWRWKKVGGIYTPALKYDRCHLLHPESPAGTHRSLPLGRILRRVLAGHSGPVREARVSGEYPTSIRFRYCVLSHFGHAGPNSPAGHSGRYSPDTPVFSTFPAIPSSNPFLEFPPNASFPSIFSSF